MNIRVLHGDCREIMPKEGPFDLIIADPPYGDTSLNWDRRVGGWQAVAFEMCKSEGSMWVFGSLRFFLETGPEFVRAGWRYAQDVVWEKHNGSGFHSDRFKRVHEHVVQFYRQDAAWGDVYNEVQKTPDAERKIVRRRKSRPPQMGHIENAPYQSIDGGPRIMRSVIPMRSCHGRAIHPTEKPVGLLEILIRTSYPPSGLVGDFFAGSAAAGEAAALAGRRYVGCELDPGMTVKASDRLRSSLFVGAA